MAWAGTCRPIPHSRDSGQAHDGPDVPRRQVGFRGTLKLCNGIEEVVGSIPSGSTKHPSFLDVSTLTEEVLVLSEAWPRARATFPPFAALAAAISVPQARRLRTDETVSVRARGDCGFAVDWPPCSELPALEFLDKNDCAGKDLWPWSSEAAQPEHLPLPRPLDRCIGQGPGIDAARQSTLGCGLDDLRA
ncbi:MAG: hypothetical protein JWM36_3055 [Hyphomicrobiales bacterium]|nr:hypothetical protein [Hyphomicrobiales bacterium]